MQLSFEHTYTCRVRYGAGARVQCPGESMRACWLASCKLDCACSTHRTRPGPRGRGGLGIDGSILCKLPVYCARSTHRTGPGPRGRGGPGIDGSICKLPVYCARSTHRIGPGPRRRGGPGIDGSMLARLCTCIPHVHTPHHGGGSAGVVAARAGARGD